MIRSIYKKIIFCVFLTMIIFLTGCAGGGKSGNINDEYEKNGGCFKIDSEYISVSGVEKTYYYKGKPIEPKPTIIFNLGVRNELTEGKDYRITYVNNNKIGTGRIDITGIKTVCSGSISFEIVYDPADISSIEVASANGIDVAYEYTGSPITPVPVLMMDNETLTSDDYDISYSNNINIGEATIEITGKGKYNGSKIINFYILKKPVITCLNPTYNGTVQVIATCANGNISNAKYVAAGSYDVECDAEYDGNIIKEYFAKVQCKINPIDISQVAEVSRVEGDTLKDSIRVKLKSDGKVLNEYKEYQLTSTLKDNVYSITVTGINNYTGEIHYSFDNKKSIDNATMDLLSSVRYHKRTRSLYDTYTKYKNGTVTANYIFDGDNIVPSGSNKPTVRIGDTILTKGIDYEISYSHNNDWGLAMATITGKGDYTGTKTVPAFYILNSTCGDSSKSADLGTVTISGVNENDIHNLLNIKTDGSYDVQLYPGEELNIKITIPAICGEIIGRDLSDGARRDENMHRPRKQNEKTIGWSDFFTVRYSDIEYNEDGSIKGHKGEIISSGENRNIDEYGNVFYYIAIKAKDSSKTTPKGWKAAFQPYRTYFFTGEKEGEKKSINFSGSEIRVTIIERDVQKEVDKKGQDPVCGKVENESTTWRFAPQTICVYCSTCQQAKYCKSYTDESIKESRLEGKIQNDFVVIKGTNGRGKECFFNAYVMAHEEKELPTCGKTTGESTTWRNGPVEICVECNGSECAQDKYCQTFTGTENKTNSVATSHITIYSKSGEKINCPVNVYVKNANQSDAPVCDGASNQSTEWRDGPQTICVRCPSCEKLQYCKTYNGDEAVQVDTITVKGLNGETKECKVNVYVRNATAPACEGVKNGSTTWREAPQEVCVYCSTCKQTSYCRTYKGDREVKTDIITVTGKDNRNLECPVNVYVRKIAEYSCYIYYDSDINKVVIRGITNTNATVKKTIIEGQETTSLTPTTEKVYSGMVYFSDNHSASCKTSSVVKPKK